MIAGISKNKTPVRMGITVFKMPALHRGKNCCKSGILHLLSGHNFPPTLNENG